MTILSVSLPAMEAAGINKTETDLSRLADELEYRATGLVYENDPTRQKTRAPTRRIEYVLPPRSPLSPRADTVSVTPTVSRNGFRLVHSRSRVDYQIDIPVSTAVVWGRHRLVTPDQYVFVLRYWMYQSKPTVHLEVQSN